MKLNDEYFVKALFGAAQINQHGETARALLVVLNLLQEQEDMIEKLQDRIAKLEA